MRDGILKLIRPRIEDTMIVVEASGAALGVLRAPALLPLGRGGGGATALLHWSPPVRS